MSTTDSTSSTGVTGAARVERDRLRALLEREQAAFAERNPRSAAAYAEADSLFGRVPMTWMNKTCAHFPLYLDTARGAHVTDVDGHEYVDFSLGDTGSMAGHSPAPVVEAVRHRVEQLGGLAVMLPTAQAQAAGAELAARFGLPRWSFSLTATDANRWAIRLARAVTDRSKILVNSYCYHGSVDESLIVTSPEGGAPRPGNVGAPVAVTETSRVAEFNDLDGLARELAHGDVAAVLMEPALTNIGIVLPEPGYLEGVRELTRRYGSLLIIDETHTFCAGVGGATRAWGLEPDVVTIGKAIGGGIPAGAYGLSAELADRLLGREDLDLIDMGGVGGTLAGNALSIAAVCATLGEVLTEEAFAHMHALAERFEAGVARVIGTHRLPWSVTRLGARVEYRFADPAPRTGTEAAAVHDQELDDYLHTYLANRGILMTPFHNMALMSPATTEADVDLHSRLFAEAVALLLGPDAAA
ncbi:aminotransferase class III-fold pyridoxal phosphate-dependent enzyme [Actinospica durhamensis]|uniref:Aminotransferase class III-fold pyridoxal phosphate-dependent enzyme n=1 Tax=Actinospica durhamensis TaxID=1508375 RepID=A0A941ERJ7_9ACTN|nr:transaminase [Actinospica durhamensis]MBR7835791.1 aminotransferase class III-fold pyridoxal phosphate-dependent enzyme [Actinospica durhamensis]